MDCPVSAPQWQSADHAAACTSCRWSTLRPRTKPPDDHPGSDLRYHQCQKLDTHYDGSTAEADRGVEGHERRSAVGGIDGDAGAVGNERVFAVLAVAGMARGASLEPAVEGAAAVVPAAEELQ